MVRAYFTVRLLQVVLPWIGRFFLFLFALVVMAEASLWVGIPKAVEATVDEWMNRLVEWGMPTIWDQRADRILRIIAFTAIVAGWILLSHITVWLTKQIF